MAAAVSARGAGNHAHRRQWRYTWEALGHLPLLRLYLFPRPALPDFVVSALRADVRLDDSNLLLSFTLAGEAVSVRVPVPRVLIDPSAPVECRAAEDHIEVRLALVLPVDHPVVTAAFPPALGSEPPSPLTLRNDFNKLSAGDVHLYCKHCSARLTKEPLRNIMEMPSSNWEDVADNWFGGCCTSFGGASEKLVSNFISAYGRLEGTSLLDTTSISIELDYLETDLLAQVARLTLSSDSTALEEVVPDGCVKKHHTAGMVELKCSEEQSNITCIHSEKSVADQSGTSHLDNDGVNYEKSENYFLVDPCHGCCASEQSGKPENNPSPMSLGNQNKQTMLETKRDYKLSKTISLGSSFVIKASNLLSDFKWVEFLCARCSSPLGSYPSQCSLVPADGRIRLFKCYTSTKPHVAGPDDIFRGHTLERLFVNLLLEVAEDEISFRTVVRDLESKRPILQLVLLSSKAWLFSGCSYENDMYGSHGTADLQPSVKLLYSNCSNASESELRIVEEWSSKHRAEELYMMKHQSDELIKFLSSATDNFPSSCSSLEGMFLSSLRR